MDEELPEDGNSLIQSEQIQKENMEVHHHPDLHHKKKRVTLGFLAESLREHISEKDRAEIFAHSLIEDFRADTVTLHQLIYYTNQKIKKIDSLDYYVHTARNRTNDSLLYSIIIYVISTFQFDNINGTYEQIKNSGSLRFFGQTLVNNLNRYDATAQKLRLMEDWENKFLYEKVIAQTQDMVNYKVIDDLRNLGQIHHEMYLRDFNSQSVDVLVNQANVIKNLRARQLTQQKILRQKAEEILVELTREFHS